jgi:hypothetical protein
MDHTEIDRRIEDLGSGVGFGLSLRQSGDPQLKAFAERATKNNGWINP